MRIELDDLDEGKTAARRTGTLRGVNEVRGFGFIVPDEVPGEPNCQYFVHVTSLRHRQYFTWADGTRATFVPGEAEAGSRKAPPALDVVEMHEAQGTENREQGTGRQ